MSHCIRETNLATSHVVRSRSRFLSMVCMAAIAVSLLGRVGYAASVTFSGPVTITSDAILDQPGTIVHAGRWAANAAPADIVVTTPALTVITFTKRGVDTTEAASGTETKLFDTTDPPVTDPAYFDATGTTVSSAFEAALDNFAYGDGLTSPFGTLRVGGLTSGRQYELQLLVSDDRAGIGDSAKSQFGEHSDKTGNITSSFFLNTSPSFIASFTADNTFQDIYIFGYASNDSNNGFARTLNAYVLRDVTPVPEPTTGTVLFLGGMVLTQMGLRRRGERSC